jgi:hypothetical protein
VGLRRTVDKQEMPSYLPQMKSVPSGSVVQLCIIGTRAHQVSHLGVCVVVLVVDVDGVGQPLTAIQSPQMKTAPPRSVGHA